MDIGNSIFEDALKRRMRPPVGADLQAPPTPAFQPEWVEMGDNSGIGEGIVGAGNSLANRLMRRQPGVPCAPKPLSGKRIEAGIDSMHRYGPLLPGLRRGGRYQPWQPFIDGEDSPELQIGDDGRAQVVGMNGPEVRTSDSPGTIVPLSGDGVNSNPLVARLSGYQMRRSPVMGSPLPWQAPYGYGASDESPAPQETQGDNPLAARLRRPPAPIDGTLETTATPSTPVPAPTAEGMAASESLNHLSKPPKPRPYWKSNTGDPDKDSEDYIQRIEDAPYKKTSLGRRILAMALDTLGAGLQGRKPELAMGLAGDKNYLQKQERQGLIADEEGILDHRLARRLRRAQIDALPDKAAQARERINLQKRAQLLRQLQGMQKYDPKENPQFAAQLEEADIHADAFDKSKGTNLQRVWIKGQLHNYNPRTGTVEPVYENNQIVTDQSLVPVEEGGLWVKPGTALTARATAGREAKADTRYETGQTQKAADDVDKLGTLHREADEDMNYGDDRGAADSAARDAEIEARENTLLATYPDNEVVRAAVQRSREKRQKRTVARTQRAVGVVGEGSPAVTGKPQKK